MKIIILGVNGLIGNGLYRNLKNKKNIDLYVSYRDKKKFELFFSNYNLEKSIHLEYNKNFDTYSKAISLIKPDIIINCIGITKHLSNKYLESEIFDINSNFPIKLKNLSDTINSRLIQISTDCVFLGDRGKYSEQDKPDANDVYGKSKVLGEINDNKHLTIRTSTIGFENSTKFGLLEWFLSQEKACNGFKNAFFSGLTIYELSEIFYNYIFFNSKINGLFHISSEKISKYELLNLFAKYFNKDIKIIPNFDFKIDRTLDNTKFINEFNYKTKNWSQMVKLLSESNRI